MVGSYETPDLPLPNWQFSRKNRLSAELYKKVFGPWLGEMVDEEILGAMAEDLYCVLGLGSQSAKEAAVDTIAQYVGHRLDESLNRLLCMQFAWNEREVKKGKTLRRFTSVLEFQWLPFQIGDVDEDQQFGRDVARLRLLCIGGFAAGYTTTKTVPWNFLRFFAYQIGFNRRWIYDSKPRSLMSLRFAGLIEPSDASDLKFHRFRVNNSMKKHNIQFIRKQAIDAWEEARLR